MTRLRVLQAGYALLGVAVLCLVGAVLPSLSALVIVSPVIAFAGAVMLAFSDDHFPKWAGFAFIAYAIVMLLVFLAATPATIRLSFFKGFANTSPSPVWGYVVEYLALALPIMVTATALVAAWERENGARLLLAGALVGILAVAVLTFALQPGESDTVSGADASEANRTRDLLDAEAKASSQGGLLRVLLALSVTAGSAGALWAAWRPDEYA